MRPSDSELECIDVAEQLTAFAAAQLLREENAKLKKRIAELEATEKEMLATISRLSEELNVADSGPQYLAEDEPSYDEEGDF